MSFAAEFEHDGIRILGYSVAGEETWYALPELNLGFDLGRTPPEMLSIDHVFLSHGHIDHSAGLAYYFGQREFLDNSPGTLYLHEHLVEPTKRLLRCWADIDGHEPPSNVRAVQAGVDVTIRRDVTVRPFEVNHARRRADGSKTQCLGFAVLDVRQKLKDEFAGLEGPQLVELKKKGIEITRRVEIPLVTYCGDTAMGDFLDLEVVRRARVLLMECTFYDPDHRDRARAGMHMHALDMRNVLPRLENERILLTHVTRRTHLGDARAALRAALGGPIDERVSFFMEHRRRRRRDGTTPSGQAAEQRPAN